MANDMLMAILSAMLKDTNKEGGNVEKERLRAELQGCCDRALQDALDRSYLTHPGRIGNHLYYEGTHS